MDSIDYTSMVAGEIDETTAETARKSRSEKKHGMKNGQRSSDSHCRSYRSILKNSPTVGEAVATSAKPATAPAVNAVNATNGANGANGANATNATNTTSATSGTNGAEGKKEGKQHTKKSQKKAGEKKVAEKKAVEKVKNEEDGWKTITEKKH